jgi:hypothetical protein
MRYVGRRGDTYIFVERVGADVDRIVVLPASEMRELVLRFAK